MIKQFKGYVGNWHRIPFEDYEKYVGKSVIHVNGQGVAFIHSILTKVLYDSHHPHMVYFSCIGSTGNVSRVEIDNSQFCLYIHEDNLITTAPLYHHSVQQHQ